MRSSLGPMHRRTARPTTMRGTYPDQVATVGKKAYSQIPLYTNDRHNYVHMSPKAATTGEANI